VELEPSKGFKKVKGDKKKKKKTRRCLPVSSGTIEIHGLKRLSFKKAISAVNCFTAVNCQNCRPEASSLA
jgi:hypothetical protein